ncbi:UNVERIFIED_CONTAM: hypothetical protein RMT77_014168 [Armadillidium vulgare]
MSPERVFLLLQCLSSIINSAVSQVFDGEDHGRFITNTESTVAHTVLSHLEGVKEPFSTGRGARPGNDCGNRDISQCTELLEVLTRKEIGFAATQKELNDMCPVLLSGLQCIDNYTLRCLNPQHRSYFNELYAGTIRVIKDLCNTRGQYQQEYIRHAPCMRQVHPKYNRCSETYHEKTAKLNKVNSAVVQFSETERRRNVITLCCSFQEYLQCSEQIVYETCGNVTAQFTRQFLNRMAGPIVQKPCFDTSFITQHCFKSYGKPVAVAAASVVNEIDHWNTHFDKLFGDQPLEREKSSLDVENTVTTATEEEDTNVECCRGSLKRDQPMKEKRKEAVLKYLTKFYMSKTGNTFSKSNQHLKIPEDVNNTDIKNNSSLINNISVISNQNNEEKNQSSLFKEHEVLSSSVISNLSGSHNNNSSLFVNNTVKQDPIQTLSLYNKACGNNTSFIKRRRISNNGMYHGTEYQKRNGSQRRVTPGSNDKPLIERNVLLGLHPLRKNDSFLKFKKPLKIRHRKRKKNRKGKTVLKFGKKRFLSRNETLEERKVNRLFPYLRKTHFYRKNILRSRNCTGTYENQTKGDSDKGSSVIFNRNDHHENQTEGDSDKGSSVIFNRNDHQNHSTLESNSNFVLETHSEADWNGVDSPNTFKEVRLPIFNESKLNLHHQNLTGASLASGTETTKPNRNSPNNHDSWYVKGIVEFDVNTTLSQKEGTPITDGVYYNVSLPTESITEKEFEDFHKFQEYPEGSYNNMQKLQFLLQTQIESIVFPAPEPKPLPVIALENFILQRYKNPEYFVPKLINIPEADFVSMKHPVQELLNKYKNSSHRPNSAVESSVYDKNSSYSGHANDKSINSNMNLRENYDTSEEKFAQDSKGTTGAQRNSISCGSKFILYWGNALLVGIMLRVIS